jgi:hypothetical protein
MIEINTLSLEGRGKQAKLAGEGGKLLPNKLKETTNE